MWQHTTQDIAWEDDAVLLGRDDVSDFNPENVLPLPAEKISKIRAWLRPTAYEDEDSEFNKHLTAHLRGTGKWFLDSQEYRNWYGDQENGSLWVRGIPGSGKSVYAAMLTHHLRQKAVPVLFFFFRQTIDANRQPVAALRDWLAQLLLYSPPLQARLSQYMAASRTLESLSTVDLWRDLRMSLRRIPRAFLVVDALDEMDRGDEMHSFLENLAQLARWRPAQTKVIMTSRPVAYVEAALRSANAIDIRLQEKLVDLDIAAFVNYRLASSGIDADDQELIKTAVPGHANGLFLYAKLAMDALLQPGVNIPSALKTLPQGLNVMYNTLLQEHAHRSGLSEAIQLLLLEFVTHATRPLRLREMASMINVTKVLPENRNLEATKAMVRLACGPLLEILPDETVSVIHHSLTEFLTGVTRDGDSGGYPILKAANTHHQLSLICVAYLRSEILGNRNLPSTSGGRAQAVYEALKRDTFARYAGKNWFVHARKAALAGADQSDLIPILDNILVYPNMLDIMVGSGISGTYTLDTDAKEIQLTPVYAASVLGLHNYVKILLSRPGTEFDQGPCAWESPIFSASRDGYTEIVEALLHAGADHSRRAREPSGRAPLHYATGYNRPEVIKLLLDSGADPMMTTDVYGRSSLGRQYPSAFELAYILGHLAAFRAFLPYINSEQHLSRALLWAVSKRRSDMMAAVLARPLARVNMETTHPAPLFLASANRDPVMVRMLLQFGADATMVCNTTVTGNLELRCNALHAWAAADEAVRGITNYGRYSLEDQKHEPEATIEVFNLLVEAGADINHLNSVRSTPLHYANEVLAARLLIDAGADVNAANKNGDTLLCLTRDRAMLQYLLEEAKASTKPRPRKEEPLMLQRLRERGEKGNDAMEQVQMFLNHGADPSVVGSYRHTALHLLAQRNWHEDSEGEDARVPLMKRLLQSGLNINARDSYGRTALHLLSSNPHNWEENAELFSVMLNAGADIDAKDELGQTPLFFNLTSGMDRSGKEMINFIEDMLRNGADLDTTDCLGRLLIHVLVSKGDEDVIQWLVERQVDLRVTDAHGNTLFHQLMKCYPIYSYGNGARDLGNLEKLVSVGVDPQQPNADGRTPLHIASTVNPGAFRSQMWDVGSTTVFDWLLHRQHDVDAADRYGITALHSASTFSEYMTRRLLESGADPLRPTNEGLNGLHLAARAREANILDMVLKTVVTRYGDNYRSALNKCTEHPRSPLFYACASGRPESVKLLLDDGFAPEPVDYKDSALQGVVSFEEENRNWPEFATYQKDDSRDVGSVTLNDNFRMATQRGPPPSERIDEILDMLISHELIKRDHIDEAIEEATKKKYKYTLDCLLHVRNQLGMDRKWKDVEQVSTLIDSRRNYQRYFEEKISGGNSLAAEAFTAAMEARFFDVVSRGTSPASSLQIIRDNSYHKVTLLQYLVTGGYATILERIASHECIRMNDDGIRTGEKDRRDVEPLLEPLLITACRRTVPNMEVIKVLVEKFGVNVNAPETTDERGSNRYHGKHGSALHALALGGHWWQVEVAMPYLIEHGADVNKRDKDGLTPLNAILDRLKNAKLAVSIRAVELLLQHGADVTSVGGERSCLERGMQDVEICTLFLNRVAKPPPEYLMSAISLGDPGVVERLLEAGADPNGRRAPRNEDVKEDESFCNGMREFFELDLKDKEMFPLHYTVSSTRLKEKESAQADIFKLLLKYGADLLAKYESSTLLHQLFIRRAYLPVLRLLEKGITGLNPNCRDGQGATLFQFACQYEEDSWETSKQHSPAEMLLSYGADIYAKDNKGCNTLHYLARTYPGPARLEMLPHVAASAPELVNERNNDGQTPLHLLVQVDYCEGLDALLNAGADAAATDSEGNTPLHLFLGSQIFTVSWPTVDVTVVEPELPGALDQLLARPGVDINAVNNAGETPISEYIRHGGSETGQSETDEEPASRVEAREAAVLDLFDARGADWTVRNKKGETLMHVAAGQKFGRVGRIKYLLSKGVDPAAEDEELRTALDVAAREEARDVLRLFGRKDRDDL